MGVVDSARVFAMDKRANSRFRYGWIGNSFTRNVFFGLKHSNVCLETSDSPTSFTDFFSRCLTKTCRGIGSQEFSLPIDERIKC